MSQRMENIKGKAQKSIKKLFYRNVMKRFKNLLCLMIVGGVLCAAVYSLRYCYIEYAVSRAKISLTYPEITESLYPDGSRFTYYDFISPDRLEEALAIMQAEGKYENFTADDLKNSFYVYSYLSGTSVSAVSEARSDGNDFSYVANEYKVTFVQPHDYKNENILMRFFMPDYSDEFLEALMDVNKQRFNKAYGGAGAFESLIMMEDESAYDYGERVEIYKTKINTILNYLNGLNNEADNFATEDNKTLQDMIGKYKILNSNKLDAISSFIDASGLTSDMEVTVNKLNINIEDNTILRNIYEDQYQINSYAQEAYDHTFTENLIVVTHSDEEGLYQARPKTAFDEVVSDKLAAKQNAVERNEKIAQLSLDISKFGTVTANQSEYDRLRVKCDELFAELDTEYQALGEESSEVVQQCLNEMNKDYMISKVEKKKIISTNFLVKNGVVFCIGALVMFFFYVVWDMKKDLQRQKKKRQKIKKMKVEED